MDHASYLAGWHAALEVAHGMNENKVPVNKIVLRLKTHYENELVPWAQSNVMGSPAPESDLTWTEPADVRDVASTVNYTETLGKP